VGCERRENGFKGPDVGKIVQMRWPYFGMSAQLYFLKTYGIIEYTIPPPSP
jgi:hypothetical protein